ncbi:MAG: histidinol dehydrogenase [Chitinispirillaceae bacterium]|nr:histidinol dehydrogenase [Chitinispirillaceae bacterium]
MSKRDREIPVIRIGTAAGKRFMRKMQAARQKRDAEVAVRVSAILEAVRKEGDRALLRYTETYDKVRLSPATIKAGAVQIDAAAAQVSRELKGAINSAAKRIKAYHRKQTRTGFTMQTAEGTLGQLIVPLRRVGLYIPGGVTVYPSTVLMNAIPARVAGVEQIVAITPPRNELDPGIAFALKLLNITEVYRVGGAQGIAALAYGTKTIPAVDKIVGPGNAYVQTAKRLLYGTIDIDSVAGPSEVVIMADRSARPEWVALDLLAQAEHGSGDEFAVCVTEDAAYAQKVANAVRREIRLSPVKPVIERLPAHAIVITVTGSRDESIALVNDIAPEHLQIMTRAARQDLRGIANAAAIFIGPHTPVALGDYFIGTNHVLPTGGAARFASPLGVDSFVKRISVAEATPAGLDRAAPYVSVFARSEAFIHHALSVERRC